MLKYNITFSDTEVCVLGVNAAGWTELHKQEKDARKIVYGFGHTPLDDGDSFYHLHHQGREMSEANKNFFKATTSGELLDRMDQSLSFEQKNELIKVYDAICNCIGIDNDITLGSNQSLKQALEKAKVDPYYFLFSIGSSIKKKQGLVDLGMQLETVNTIEGTMKKLLETTDSMFPCSSVRYKEIATSDFTSVQIVMWESKRIIADTFQENLRRYYAKKPLISIKMTISSDQRNFSIDLPYVKDKSDAFVSSSEIRMIYKLMNEVTEPVSKEIMSYTVSFLKQKTDGTFEAASAPLSAELWNSRPRGQREEKKPSYKQREGGMPQWIIEIVNNQGVGPASRALSATSSPKSDSDETVKRM